MEKWLFWAKLGKPPTEISPLPPGSDTAVSSEKTPCTPSFTLDWYTPLCMFWWSLAIEPDFSPSRQYEMGRSATTSATYAVLVGSSPDAPAPPAEVPVAPAAPPPPTPDE